MIVLKKEFVVPENIFLNGMLITNFLKTKQLTVLTLKLLYCGNILKKK
jgi:hypothetical protein